MAPANLSIRELTHQVSGIEVLPWIGEVTDMAGLLIASRGPVVSIGDFIEVRTSAGRSIRSQVIGFRNERVLSMPLEETDGLQPGDRVTHDKYGLGRVEEVSGVGESAMSLIDFGSSGRVKLMHNHAPVTKL